MRAPPVVCVLGISGVGKSTLIGSALAKIPGALHVQASALIKLGLADAAMDSEQLRRAGGDRIIANQSVLVEVFGRTIAASTAPVVVFGGHLVIDSDNGLVTIPLAVIAALQPQLLIHVEDRPEAVVSRRQRDTTRRRPVRSEAVLGDQQPTSRQLCTAYSEALGIECIVLTTSAADVLTERLLGVCLAQRG